MTKMVTGWFRVLEARNVTIEVGKSGYWENIEITPHAYLALLLQAKASGENIWVTFNGGEVSYLPTREAKFDGWGALEIKDIS